MKIIKNKKLIPLNNPNFNLTNPNDLLKFIKNTPILNNKDVVIGIVLEDSETYIKNNFVYGDICIFLEEYENYEFDNATFFIEKQDNNNNNNFLVKSIQSIIFDEKMEERLKNK